MQGNYIKLHRQLTQWEWYQDAKMLQLFIHLLLSANYKDKSWRGIEVKRGQCVTGLNSLSKTLKMSVQSLRTCLNRLKSTGEITTKTTNKYTLVTLVNYEAYQDSAPQATSKSTRKTTNEQQTNNKQTTTTKKEKKENNIELRAQKFTDEVLSFKAKYPLYMLNDFTSYWTEPNRAKGKMRFELQPTFEISRRLSTWASRDKQYKPESKGEQSNPYAHHG